MKLSLNEIRDRAIAFSKEWAADASEDAEAKSFWDAFFNVFGVSRRRVASFEVPVKKTDGHGGYIDLLWRGTLLIEHKSKGRDLDRAKGQALSYFNGLQDRDLPRYVVVSDFARIRLYDLDEDSQVEFPLAELPHRIDLFGFISGYEKVPLGVESEANVRAAQRLGDLHDLLEASGYTGHHLEVLMVRLLFCLFADDTLLFEKGSFREYVEQRTSEDGTDLGPRLQRLFDVLNTPVESRQKTLDEQLATFPYVNGRLFDERLPFPDFDSKMRAAVLEAAALDWSKISPAIFGSLFQSIMNAKERRDKGAHYTTEFNILKAITPLFMESLRAEFETVKTSTGKLRDFQKRLRAIRILDPACGCGNFLVIAYRELRLLELDVVRALQRNDRNLTIDLKILFSVDVDQFYGIEIDEWPARIAEVAMWMMDHQMNMLAAKEFGFYFARLPLRNSPNIYQGNAVTTDWRIVVSPSELSYIVGNPPFIGKKEQKEEKKRELMKVFEGVKGAGILDYVACWYQKATEIMEENGKIRTAFVSTNSITQGEQVSILWRGITRRGFHINFAHRTFQWSSEARGRAAVQCVIVGFWPVNERLKTLYDYETPKSLPKSVSVSSINPYLAPTVTTFVETRSKPISAEAPEMNYGSMPIDDGNLILSEEERAEILSENEGAKNFIRRYVGGDEFLNGTVRYCLWLVDASPAELKKSPAILKRIRDCQEYRRSSNRRQTLELGDTPGLFGEIRQPKTSYILVPKVSSENRRYIPIGFCRPEIVASGTALIVPNGDMFCFGLLSSGMHNAWMRAVGGRLESRYQYSASIVYNNFSWPKTNDNQKKGIVAAAKEILSIRKKYKGASLSDLYNPQLSPADLVKAHAVLDRRVEQVYSSKSFSTEAERVALLFELYELMQSPLFPAAKRRSGRRR